MDGTSTRLAHVGGASSLQVEAGGPHPLGRHEGPRAGRGQARGRDRHAILDDFRASPESLDWFYVSPPEKFGAWVAGARHRFVPARRRRAGARRGRRVHDLGGRPGRRRSSTRSSSRRTGASGSPRRTDAGPAAGGPTGYRWRVGSSRVARAAARRRLRRAPRRMRGCPATVPAATPRSTGPMCAISIAELSGRSDEAIAELVSADRSGMLRGGRRRGHGALGGRRRPGRPRRTAPRSRRETRFDIASVSKQFTATAILMLQREGSLSARRSGRRRTSRACRRGADTVTLDQLIHHTSRIPDYWMELEDVGIRFGDAADQQTTLQAIARETKLEPGKRIPVLELELRAARRGRAQGERAEAAGLPRRARLRAARARHGGRPHRPRARHRAVLRRRPPSAGAGLVELRPLRDHHDAVRAGPLGRSVPHRRHRPGRLRRRRGRRGHGRALRRRASTSRRTATSTTPDGSAATSPSSRCRPTARPSIAVVCNGHLANRFPLADALWAIWDPTGRYGVSGLRAPAPRRRRAGDARGRRREPPPCSRRRPGGSPRHPGSSAAAAGSGGRRARPARARCSAGSRTSRPAAGAARAARARTARPTTGWRRRAPAAARSGGTGPAPR